ncbi:hypothetical protein ACFYNO_39385 [Kitasatospora sp. NPDC006697]|uniref:hypothetical protein n=1 Tax=Kitasatospora sp. NPDC006697 TaxID=3364020 RepID=UPI0036B67DD7
MTIPHDDAVLNPKEVKQRQRQSHTEPTLGLLHHLVRQRLVDAEVAAVPERRHDLIESVHEAQPVARPNGPQLQDHLLVRKRAPTFPAR